MADHQEAIGPKAFQAVEDLNRTVLSKFSTLKSFNESLTQSNIIKATYEQVVMPKIQMKKVNRTFNTSVNTTID